MLNNTLVDNSTDELSMCQALKTCISNPLITEIKIATGYWDLPGMALVFDELKAFLEQENTTFYLLIGKEPQIFPKQQLSPKEKSPKYPEDFVKKDIRELELKKEYQQVVNLLLDYCNDRENSKIQIRVYRKNEHEETQFLHSKCYIFNGKNVGYGIIGSSNFTQKGLQGNAELNYLETTPHIVKFGVSGSIKGHIGWFNEKWEISQPWNKIFEEILLKSPIGEKVIKERAEQQPLSPYELYIKLLQDKFGTLIEKDSSMLLENYIPDTIQTLDYQIEAVKWCYSIMQTHGGFMLGDVVGLGKTIVGVMLAKYFLEFAENEGRQPKILIVCPPAIKSTWIDTIALFDKDRDDKIMPYVDFITTGSIGKLLDEEDYDADIENDGDEFAEELKQENYGLILIDESHKFRNNNTGMYQSLDDLINSVYSKNGYYPYIGLLSATMQNNSPSDLKNQIYLFQRTPKNSTFESIENRNLESFFADINRRYKMLIQQKNLTPEEKRDNKSELIKLSEEIRNRVLSDILVRRTRTDIKKLPDNALTFPEVKGPIRLEYRLDAELAQLFYDTMNLISPSEDFKFDNPDYLCYYRYRATEFLSPELKNRYKGRNMTAETSSERLAKIMQIMLVKRLESSFVAFKKSLRNLQRYTQNMITMWEKDCIFICPQLDINAELNIDAKIAKQKNKLKPTLEQCFEDIRRKIEKLNKEKRNEKQQNAEYRRTDFKQEYIELLKKDLSLIDSLIIRWGMNDYDPKLDEFKEQLKTKLFNPDQNKPQKLVIFSEAIDTVLSLERAVHAKGFRPLIITAKNRKEKELTIKENFDANYKGEWKNDYDTIITTEVLSEGINLHRANVILNYDTPWNSTRLIQRIGRVNRIGSKEKNVYVYNFYPSSEGDHEINLVQNAYNKLQSFHSLFGEDNQVFSEEEQLFDAAYSKHIDGEETPEQKYITELKNYKQNNQQRYAELLAIKENLQAAVNSEKSESLFAVKTKDSDKGCVFVCVDSVGKASVISGLEMLKRSKCPENMPLLSLPANIAEFQKTAMDTFNIFSTKLHRPILSNKIITEAKRIIQEWINAADGISQESKNLLHNASLLVRKGNLGIARKIVKIGENIGSPQQAIFLIAQEEVDNQIISELKNINSQVAQARGEAYIYITLNKYGK